MALTRLLRAKQTIQFSRIGYTNSARWYSSSDGEIDKSTSSKKGAAAREQKEKAVESYVNKYMQENPGVFPKPSYVQKEVGGSWNILKNILQNVKEKLLGKNDVQLHEPSANIDSKVTKGPDKTEVHGEKITVSPIMKDTLSGDISNDMVTKAIREKDYLDNLDQNPSIDSKAMDGSNGEKNTVLPVVKDTLSGNTVNSTVANAIPEKDCLGDTKIDSESMNGRDESNFDKEEILMTSVMRDMQSVSTTNLPASKTITENGCLDNVEVSTSSVKPKDFVAESKIFAKILREEVSQESIRSDVSKMTDVTSGEKASLHNFNSTLISNSNKLSSDNSGNDSFLKRLRQIGYANQEDKKMNNSSPVLSNIFQGVRKSPATVKHNRFTNFQDTSKTLQELVEMKLTSNDYENNQSSPSKGPSQKESLIQTNEEFTFTIQTNEKVTPASPQEFSVGGERKSSDLKVLVDCVKVLPIREESRIVKNSTQMEYKEGVDTKFSALKWPNSTRSPLKKTDPENKDGVDSNFNTMNRLNSTPVPLKITDMENKGINTNSNTPNRLNLTRVPLETTDIEDKGVDTNFNTINRPNSTRVPLKVNEKEPSLNQWEGQHKVKLMCLPKTATKLHIYNALRIFGGIHSVEFIHDNGKNGSGLSAAVSFKMVEGLKKALEFGHVIIHDQKVTIAELQKVTIAELPTRTSNTLPIPNLISTALSGLIKNPKRTVVIKQLTPDICYYHLEEAFSFCNSKISAVVFGSSKSVAYVEFKTEEGKNKALAKHMIDVLGKQLLLTRIDAPRTTVVRLSNIANFHQIAQKLKPTCESFGRVAAFKIRHDSVLDVYFVLKEWPNMLNIVNSLNGLEIGPERLLAAPAPIYPPEILRALWNHPEEKRHVKAVVRSLIQKFGESSMDMIALANNADKLYQD